MATGVVFRLDSSEGMLVEPLIHFRVSNVIGEASLRPFVAASKESTTLESSKGIIPRADPRVSRKC